MSGKIGVSAYSFQRLINEEKFTLFDAIEYARKTGFEAIEFIDLEPPEGTDVGDFAESLQKAAEKAGLKISCYAVQADFLYGSGGNIQKETERIKRCVDIAEILGAPLLRHDVCWGLKDNSKGRSWRDAISVAADAVREVSGYAEGKGIRTMSENHGHFLQDSSRMETLVLAVNHPNYGLLVDIGNFICADEPSLTALATVMPYAFHVHVKDFLLKSGGEPCPDDSWFSSRSGNHLRGTIVGHGIIPVTQCLDYIKKTGYRGDFSLEFEGLEYPLEAVRRGYEFMKAKLL